MGSHHGSLGRFLPCARQRWLNLLWFLGQNFLCVEGAIYFGSHDGKFYALAPDGKKKWDFATGGPIISSPAIENGKAFPSALPAGGEAKEGRKRIYFSSVDGHLYALNFDGVLQWKLLTGSVTESSPVIGLDGTVYVGVNTLIWAISSDGKKIWEMGYELPVEAAPLVLADGLVCCISRYGALQALDQKGWPRWYAWLGGHGFDCPGIAPSGTLYLHDGGVSIVALRVKVPLARSAWPRFRGNARNTGNAEDPT
jgi:outer membrane protein assembly factor BamB